MLDLFVDYCYCGLPSIVVSQVVVCHCILSRRLLCLGRLCLPSTCIALYAIMFIFVFILGSVGLSTFVVSSCLSPPHLLLLSFFFSCLLSPSLVCFCSMHLVSLFDYPHSSWTSHLDGRNRAIVIAESLARVIVAIRIASAPWSSYLPHTTGFGPHRPCVRCAAIRIARLALIGVAFVPRGTAEWLARVDRVR